MHNMSEWFDVNEKLPEPDEIVLADCNVIKNMICRLDKNGKWYGYISCNKSRGTGMGEELGTEPEYQIRRWRYIGDFNLIYVDNAAYVANNKYISKTIIEIYDQERYDEIMREVMGE